MTTTNIRIDIVSDVMCPWCAVGYYSLQQALAELGDKVQAQLHWQPFELNPNAAPDGEDMLQHLMQKYGISEAQSRANRAMITERGAAVGFKFDFIEGMRMWNTFNAHQLLHWAGEQESKDPQFSGVQTALKIALFKAHFQEHINISDIDFLVELAAKQGLNAEDARKVLQEQSYATAVRDAQQHWKQANIRSVPAFIFQGKHLVAGGQPPEAFVQILTQIIEEGA